MLKEMKVYDTFLFINFKSLHFHLSTLETEPFQKALLLKPFGPFLKDCTFVSIIGRLSVAGRQSASKRMETHLVWLGCQEITQ